MSPLFLTILLTTTAASAEGAVVTNLEFYFHDIVTGINPTAMRIVQPPSPSSAPVFGTVIMADDPLTETADPKSKPIGRAQGMYGFSGQNESTLLMAMSYSFETGPYKGSTLTIMGRNPSKNPTRELPVVGGTGVFRMARGYAALETVSLSAAGDAVVHYNVTVYTPADGESSVSPVSGPDGGSNSARSWKLRLVTYVIGSICLFSAL